MRNILNMTVATLLFLAMPALANAWTLMLKVTGPTGVAGNNVTLTGGTTGTIISGTVYRYPTSAATATINTAAGYTRTIKVDGNPNIGTSFTFSSSSHSIEVAYTAVVSTNNVTITQPTNGSISIRLPNNTSSTTGATGMTVGTSLPISIAAYADYVITTYTINGVTTNCNGTVAGQALTLPFSVTASPTPNTITATYSLVPSITATLSAPLNGFKSQPVSCNAFATSNDTGLQYKFTVTAKPSGSTVISTPQGPGTSQAFSFTPDLEGSYTVQLDVTSANGGQYSTSAVISISSYVAFQNGQCTSCHGNSSQEVVALYNASPHNLTNPCQGCHTTTPHSVALPSASVCMGCHGPHAWPSINICLSCHNPHNPALISLPPPHFGTFSTARFVTTNISCNNCHNSVVDGSFNIYSANRQWARSGKGNPKSPAYVGPGPFTEANLEAYDFKALGTPLPAKPANTTSRDCVRCHTTSGFLNYITPTDPADPASVFSNIKAFGNQGDRTREMVACNACHDNTTGFDATFSRRSIGLETNPTFYPGVLNVVAWYGYSSATTKKIFRAKEYSTQTTETFNDSNICITCHSGTAAGGLIKFIVSKVGATGIFWENVDFIDPHGMSSASIMIPDGQTAGYEYRPGASTITSHAGIRLGTSQGPCVACHMSSPKKHLFTPVSTASNGVIAAITTTLCADCHGVNGTAFTINSASDLEMKKEGYIAALAVIEAQLVARGIYYNTAKPPYFFLTPDPEQQSSLTKVTIWKNSDIRFQGANLMGAAFNLRLLQTDAGWVHNGTTVKRLLYDTIDYLDDGNATNNTVSTAIQNLNIDQAIKDKADRYILPPAFNR